MVKLSASRVKTLFNCGILYYNQYIRKIPQGKNNSGAARGSCSHYVLECLLREDRKEKVKKILDSADPWTIPSVKRMAKIHADKLEVGDNENFELIRQFILVALKTDFYCDGATKVIAEQSFDIKTDKYHIGGFIDKKGFYPDGSVKIIDYKTSKAKFDAKEQSFNLQNYFYTLAAKKENPSADISLEFQFLKFPKAPIQSAPKLSDDELAGFEEWLEHVTTFIDNLTMQEASLMAAKGSYTNNWLCGSEPGKLNKAGQPAYFCSYKFPFIYFALCEGDILIKTSREKSELQKDIKEGQRIEQRYYEGCPKHRDLWQK